MNITYRSLCFLLLIQNYIQTTYWYLNVKWKYILIYHMCAITTRGLCTVRKSFRESYCNLKILKEPLLEQKQMLHHQKALDLSCLEPEGQGRGIIMRAWQCHRSQRVKHPPRTCKKSTKNAFWAKWAWHHHDTAKPLCF